MSNVLGVIGSIVFAGVMVATDSYIYATDLLFAAQTTLTAISVWDVLSALAPILAPLLALALTVLGKIIWNHEQRMRGLERGKTRQSRTLYGDEEDPQQQGLALDINDLGTRVDRLEQSIQDLRKDIKEMNDDE